MMNVTCRKQVESLISVFFQTYQHCVLPKFCLDNESFDIAITYFLLLLF